MDDREIFRRLEGVTWFTDAFLLARIERNACALATNRCENRPRLKLQTLFVVCAKPEPPYSGPIGAFWETAVNQEPSFRFAPSYHGPAYKPPFAVGMCIHACWPGSLPSRRAPVTPPLSEGGPIVPAAVSPSRRRPTAGTTAPPPPRGPAAWESRGRLSGNRCTSLVLGTLDADSSFARLFI